MKTINTKKGETIVDDFYYDFLINFNWNIDANGYAVYHKYVMSRKEARETGLSRKKMVKLHRLIYEKHHNVILTIKEHIDHINRNKLDNRIENLRISTAGDSINAINCGLRKDNTTGYKGVKYRAKTDRYEVYVDYKGKRHYGGSSKDIHEAGKLYNEIALKLHGEFAYLNEIKK